MFDALIGAERSLGWVLQFGPVLVAAFISALAATALGKKVALRFGIVDRPDNLVKTRKEPIAYLGGVCGFLPFNRHPAKIFMGDAGSVLPGFVVAALMILFAEKVPRW